MEPFTVEEQKDIHSEECYMNMGPQHPSTHGVLHLELKLDGENVIDSIAHIGYLHRSMEKIAENRTYTQFIPFTDRLDYVSAMNNNLGYCLAVEKLINIEVSERAKYIRVIAAELNRVASHLIAIGSFAQDLGALATPLFYCFREREKILDIFDEISGSRLTYNYMRIGGVQYDLPAGIDKKITDFIKCMRSRVKEYIDLLSYNIIFLMRTKNIGVLSKDVAVNYSVSGPNLRASGVKNDLRKDEPYLVYDKFQFDVPFADEGDVWARYNVRIQEIGESLKIIEQALGALPEGNPTVSPARPIRPAAGEVYLRTESPRGELGFYIVSDGSAYPYRLKIRTPSFSNLAVLRELIKGVKMADVVSILGSLDIVMGEIDR